MHGAVRVILSDRDPSTVWFKGIESMLAGAGAGLVSSVVTCPLDVIKTKLQAGGIKAARAGGLSGELLALFPVLGRRGTAGAGSGARPALQSLPGEPRAGGCSVSTDSTIFSPTSSPGVQLPRSATSSLPSFLHRPGTFKTIWKQEGFRGLYRGLGPTIFGYLPTWAIYFTVYDKVKAHMGALRGAFTVSLAFPRSAGDMGVGRRRAPDRMTPILRPLTNLLFCAPSRAFTQLGIRV